MGLDAEPARAETVSDVMAEAMTNWGVTPRRPLRRPRMRCKAHWRACKSPSARSQLGKISKEQRAGEWPVWQTALHNPSFAAYAKLCGGKGIRVTRAEQLQAAPTEAIEHQGPALVEVIANGELIQRFAV